MGALTEAYVLVLPDMGRFPRELRSGLRKVNVDTHGRDAGKKFGHSFGKQAAATATGGILADAFRAIGRSLATPIRAASDMNETLNKSNVIFGKNAASITKWASTSATSFGLSREQALSAASGFGDMFKQIGFSDKASVAMSKSTVKLSADLGSFNNLPTADVQERIAAAFRGEYDSLQKVIPNINAARVQQVALAMTGKKAAESLTAQEKAAAVLAIVQKDGARATGDFAKTQGGLANQTKIAKAQLGDIAVTVGTATLPMVTKFFGFLTSTAIPTTGRLADAFGKRIGPVLTEVSGGFRAFGVAFRAADGDVTSSGFAGFMERLANLLALQVLPALRSIGGYVRANVLPALKSLGQFVVETLLPAWLSWYGFLIKQMTPILKQVGGFIVGSVIPALGAVARFIASDVVPGFLSIVDTVKGLIRVVAPIIGQLVGVILGKFREMSPEVKSIWNSVKEIIVGVMFIVKDVIQAVTTIIRLIWDKHGEQIKKTVGDAFSAIFKIVAGIMKAVAGVIKLVVALIKGDWKGAWNAIKQIFSGVWQAIKAILVNTLGGIFATIGSRLTAIKGRWSDAWTNIKNTARSAMDWVHTKITGVLDKIKGAFQTAKTNISRTWDGVKAVVAAPINWVKDNVYNRPLVPVWNRVASLVGGPKLTTYARGGIADLERYANGGTPFGVRPGYTPGRDTHPIMVGGGEAIMRPEWTRAVGADYVNAANAAARRGSAGRFVAGREPTGFADGGIVGWIKDKIGAAGGTLADIAGKIKGFVLGGLRSAAGAILNPLKGVIDRAMPDTGVGNTVGGIGKKGIDLLLDKIGSADAAAAALAGAGGASWGGGSFRGLSSSQMQIAATIASVGSAMGKKAQLIGIIAGLVESRLTNVNFGDRDSLGVFQQRAPWGPASVRRNVRASAGMFFRGGRGGQPGLDDIRGWQGMSPGSAAQRVQVSAFPGRYGAQVPLGNAILAALGGGGPAGTGSARRVTWKGGTFTERFRNTLIRAQQLAGVPIPVIQGGFSRSVAASGTSHYGDAIDTRWSSRILSGLRRARVAAWHRTPAQGFSHHIHGIPLPGAGWPGGSGIWQAQDYLRGGNGLALGGIVRGGRGGITARIGEGRHDELVQPLPPNWKSGGSRPITINIDLGDGVTQRVQGVLDEHDEFRASVGRMR